MAYKRGRANARRQNSAQTAKKEAKEGKTYETGIGPNLDLSILPSRTMKEIETIVSPYTPRPLATYTLPVHDIDHFASKVNKLKIVKVNGERKLYKDNKEVSTLPLKEAMSQFLGFVSRSVERAKSRTNKNVVTVLLGHNSLTFDVPVLLRNSESDFKERLQAMDVFFADSLTLFKTLVREKVFFLRNPDGTFPKTNKSSLYSFLFQKSFNAHDALEDVLALRKILFESRIDLSEKTVVENSGVVSASHAAEDVIYLDRRHILMQTFKGNLHHPQYLKKNMIEKISGSGLAFQDLQRVYSRFGKEGLIATLSQPPSSSPLQSPRVTTTARILATIVKYFEEHN